MSPNQHCLKSHQNCVSGSLLRPANETSKMGNATMFTGSQEIAQGTGLLRLRHLGTLSRAESALYPTAIHAKRSPTLQGRFNSNCGSENYPESPGRGKWRRGPESNRRQRICNPRHNHFATAPLRYLPWRQPYVCLAGENAMPGASGPTTEVACILRISLCESRRY